MNAAIAVTRLILYRFRVSMAIALAYLVLAPILLATVGVVRLPDAVLILGGTLEFFACLYLVGVFIHPDSDVASPRSTYPSYYFTLPIKTIDLVLWPMALGGLLIGLSVYGLGLAILKDFRFFDPVWPALMATSLLTMLQAIFWNPTGIPYSKLLLSVLVILFAIGVGVVGGELGIAESARSGIFLTLTGLSFPVATAGVLRARRGDVREGSSPRRSSERASKARAVGKPFSSATAAQVWYEMKQQGKILPILVISMIVLFAIPLHWEGLTTPMMGLLSSHRTVPTVPTYLYIYYPLLLMCIPLAAWIIGCGARRNEVNKGDGSFHLMFATRPLSDWAMVTAKLKAVALSTAITWGGVLLVSSFFLLQTSKLQTGDDLHLGEASLFTLLQPYLTPEFVLHHLSFLGILIFFTWRNYVVGLWTDLTGKLWLRYAYPVGVIFLVVLLVAVARGLEPTNRFQIFKFAGDIAWGMLFLRVVVGAYALAWQVKNGAIKALSALTLAAGYVATVCLITLIGMYYTQDLRLQMIEAGFSREVPSYMFAGISLTSVPFLRLLFAGAALSRNRHR